MKVALAGEALIDFASVGDLRFQGYPGGSPLNTAVAVARLGQPTGYLTQLSTDLFGLRLRRHLEANAIDTRFVLSSPAPTTLAFVERAGEVNRYQFLNAGAADTLYAPDPLPALPGEGRFLHFGSVSLLAEPAATTITRLVEAHRERVTIVFDPNVRPTLITDSEAYRRRCETWIALSHLVRLSEEDATYLADGRDVEAMIAQWLSLAAGGSGPRAIVVTAGSRGATVFRADADPLTVPAVPVEVVDTIGAGDTFTAGTVVGLIERGAEEPDDLASLPDAGWHKALTLGVTAAAINCTRPGADPPTRAEVAAFRA
jgi:fructokinase